ncbi:MAG: A/G-specific adenine glycosylase, partial [Verrucomicrobiia bacterium]
MARWFRRRARDLPWRRTTDPYAIVVSEFMLQQTTVQAVIPYYERWMAHFPSWGALAVAEEEAVLRMWEGLGYYRRARNLHRLAQQVQKEWEGQLPESVAELRKLPGIGPYTAAAIMAFAHDRREPALDANIARVVARLMNDTTPIDSKEGGRRLESHLKKLLEHGSAGVGGGGRVLLGGLMEVGAVICSPSKPSC